MDQNSFFFQAMVYLAAAVVMVPIAKKLGLGSVLGYLLAGILIGPALLGFIGKEGTGYPALRGVWRSDHVIRNRA
ncbi:MAG: hypothetical protein WDO16_05700 [Bacteroidota bacterium]